MRPRGARGCQDTALEDQKASKTSPRAPKSDPKAAQKRPKSAQERPKSGPEVPKRGPRPPQERPKRVQEGSEVRPKRHSREILKKPRFFSAIPLVAEGYRGAPKI